MPPSMAPAIVIAAYNRPASLLLLLSSIVQSDIPDGTSLVFSIDGAKETPAENADVIRIAENLEWPVGQKIVRVHEKNLGLKENILSCGDLVETYGSVLILEDDLYASPHFYTYAREALAFYGKDPRIAGIGLYPHGFNETAGLPFQPLADGQDVFFLQLACSWGQAFSARQWNGFRSWLKTADISAPPSGEIPNDVRRWPDSSWKKLYIRYMIEKDLTFVYPRIGYTTNFGTPGTHHKGALNFLQVPLALGWTPPRFASPDESRAVYSPWCEIRAEKLPNLPVDPAEVCVDLYGVRASDEVACPWMLTLQPGQNPQKTYGLSMKPREMNVICDIPGQDLTLARTENVAPADASSNRLARELLYGYDFLPLRQMFSI